MIAGCASRSRTTVRCPAGATWHRGFRYGRPFTLNSRELWNHEPLVNNRGENLSEKPQQGRISILMPIGAHVFAPLVCTNLRLIAELDILMLRPEVPGRIINNGDIDNRLT